jgi:hypothetical protein
LSAQECVVVSFVRCGIIAASLMTGKFILRGVVVKNSSEGDSGIRYLSG